MPPEPLRLKPRTCVRAAGPEILRFGGQCGRMGVCRSVCTFGFRGRKAPQCLRAVGLRPDSDGFRMQPYAPYAVPLKGKGQKDPNSQKRCIKCIRLLACALSPTLHWLLARAEKVHTDCIRLHTKCIRTHKSDGSVKTGLDCPPQSTARFHLRRVVSIGNRGPTIARGPIGPRRTDHGTTEKTIAFPGRFFIPSPVIPISPGRMFGPRKRSES